MSPKELNYVDDALAHQTYLKTKCCDTVSQLNDEELRQMVQQMEQTHQQLFSKFMELV